MEKVMSIEEFERLIAEGDFLKEVAEWANENRELVNAEFEESVEMFRAKKIPDESIYSLATLSEYGKAMNIDFFSVMMAICMNEMEVA